MKTISPFQRARPRSPPPRRVVQAEGRLRLLREREPARRGPLQRAGGTVSDHQRLQCVTTAPYSMLPGVAAKILSGVPRQEEDPRRHQDLGGEAHRGADP